MVAEEKELVPFGSRGGEVALIDCAREIFLLLTRSPPLAQTAPCPHHAPVPQSLSNWGGYLKMTTIFKSAPNIIVPIAAPDYICTAIESY
jgi:hypothetical protein